MLQRVTVNFFRMIDGNICPQTEDVLVDSPDGDSAAFLACQEHGPRLLKLGALCETDEHGGRKLKMAITGIEPATSADVERLRPKPGHASDCAVHNMPAFPNGPCDCGLTPKPEPASEATKAGADMPDVKSTAGKAEEALKLETLIKNKGGRPKGSKNRAKEAA